MLRTAFVVAARHQRPRVLKPRSRARGMSLEKCGSRMFSVLSGARDQPRLFVVFIVASSVIEVRLSHLGASCRRHAVSAHAHSPTSLRPFVSRFRPARRAFSHSCFSLECFSRHFAFLIWCISELNLSLPSFHPSFPRSSHGHVINAMELR